MNPETVVRNFCRAFSRLDIQELLGFFREDAVYHNIPVAPAEGLAAIEATLKMFVTPGGRADFEILNLATRGNVVLTERVDHLEINGKAAELPVMGAFEVGEDGKIVAWRDYFDMAQFSRQVS